MPWKPLPDDVPLDHEALSPPEPAAPEPAADPAAAPDPATDPGAAPPAQAAAPQLTALPADARLDDEPPPEPVATVHAGRTPPAEITAHEVNPTYTEQGFSGEVAADPVYHTSWSDKDRAEYAAFFADPRKPPTAEALRQWVHSKNGTYLANADEIVREFRRSGGFNTHETTVLPTTAHTAVRSTSQHYANALLGDYGAEITAPLGALGVGPSDRPSIWNSDGQSFGDLVSQNADITLAQNKRDTAEHPIASAAGEIGGLLTVAPVGGAVADLARVGKLGEIGASFAKNVAGGAIVGAGAAGPGDRIEGAAVGAGLAPVVAVAARVPAAGYRAVRSVLEGSPGAARRIIAKAIRDDANTGESVGQDLAAAQANDVPMALGDTGENVRGLLAAASRKSGLGRTIARAVLGTRQAELADRVVGHIERDLGPIANPHEVADQMMTKASKDAAPLYDSFYSQPSVSDPALDGLLSRPSMQKALKNAYRIAQEEGRDPEALGFRLGEDESVSVEHGAAPAASAKAERLAAVRRNILAYEHRLAWAQSRGEQDVISSVEPTLERFRSEERELANETTASAPTGTAAQEREKVAAYTPQTLDYIKRGMDDVVESYKDPVTGKYNFDTEGRAVNNTLRSFLEIADKRYPDWKAARAAYAGPVKGVSAMNLGRKFVGMGADDIEARMRDMSPFEKKMAALGARRQMAELVRSKGDTADTVHALVGSGKKRAMLARLFGDRKGFQRFVDTLDQEKQGVLSFKQALGGSPTSPNLQDDVALEAVTTGVEMVIHGGVPVATATRKLSQIFGRQLGEKTQQQIAALLSNTDHAALSKLAAELQRGAARRARTAEVGKTVRGSLGRSVVVLQAQQSQ